MVRRFGKMVSVRLGRVMFNGTSAGSVATDSAKPLTMVQTKPTMPRIALGRLHIALPAYLLIAKYASPRP